MDIKIDKEYSINELSQILETPNTTIYSWEKALNIKTKRKSDNSRFYNEQDLELYKKIKELREKKFSLKSIKDALENTEAFQDMQEVAVTQIPLESLTAQEIEKVVSKSFEKALKGVLNQAKEDLREVIKEELRDELRKEFEYQNKQKEAENIKLLNIIETKFREEKEEKNNKSFLKRLFNL
jgi:DNA-binding transcriptional MerR regulator